MDIAVDYLRRGKSFASSIFGPSDPSVSNMTLFMADIYIRKSQPDSSIKLTEKYFEMRTRQSDFLDSTLLERLLYLSLVHADNGRCLLAESLIVRVLAEPSVTKPQNAQFFADANLLIGGCQAESGDFTTAIQYYEPAVRFARQAYGSHAPRLTPFLRWFGNALFRTRKYRRANSLYNELLAVCILDPNIASEQLSNILKEKAAILEGPHKIAR